MAAVELLIATPAVRDVLRDGGRTGELRKLMADGRKQQGSQTFQQNLDELVEGNVISPETAKAALALTTPASPGGKRGGKQTAG